MRYRIAPWIVFFAASVVSGLMTGYLTWKAVASLALFSSTVYAAKTFHQYRALRVLLLVATTGIMTLALSMHKFPGFANPALAENMRFSSDAPATTLHTNFDMISAGLILMALFCNPVHGLTQWKHLLRRTAPIAAVTLVIVFSCAVGMGYVRFNVKVTSYTAIFLITNLLFTCVAEEAFFRGFMQEQLMRGMSGWRAGITVATAISAALFGVSHASGGFLLVLLATIAGLGYAYAYLSTRRVEAAILTHFLLNAVHFVAFTYPNLVE